MTDSSAQRLSEVVRALRFPLILLVVFAHVPLGASFDVELPLAFPASAHGWYLYVSRIGSYVFAYLTVPMFFLFSGYYMYAKPKAWWTKAVYVGEVKKRWKTLILPYLIWCTLPLIADQAMLLVKGEPLPWTSWSSGTSRLLYAYVTGPENFPLWYVRDLILLAFLAPVIAWISQRGLWLLALLYIVYLGGWWPVEVPTIRGIVYFTLGAVLGSRQVDLISLAERARLWLIPLFLLATFLLPFLPRASWAEPLQLLFIPLAMGAFFYFGSRVYTHLPKVHRFCLGVEKYVFFIYVAHEVLILSAVRGFFYKQGWLETVWGYFLCGGVITLVCVLGYETLARIARRPLAVSLGGRL